MRSTTCCAVMRLLWAQTAGDSNSATDKANNSNFVGDVVFDITLTLLVLTCFFTPADDRAGDRSIPLNTSSSQCRWLRHSLRAEVLFSCEPRRSVECCNSPARAGAAFVGTRSPRV